MNIEYNKRKRTVMREISLKTNIFLIKKDFYSFKGINI